MAEREGGSALEFVAQVSELKKARQRAVRVTPACGRC
jgi:hypothetical protein